MSAWMTTLKMALVLSTLICILWVRPTLWRTANSKITKAPESASSSSALKLPVRAGLYASLFLDFEQVSSWVWFFEFSGSVLMKNKITGIRHDPTISAKQQLEIAGWFKLSQSDYNAAVTYSPIMLPRFYENSVIDFSNEGDTKYIITERLHNSQQVNKTYLIKVSNKC